MTTALATADSPSPTLPPGPSFRPLTTLRILREPETWLKQWGAKYGDPFLVHTMNGRVVVISDPVEIKKIFAAPPDTFEVFAPHALRPLLGETSVIASDEPRHMRDRKLIMPPFHGDRMRAYGEEMVEATRHALASHQDGAPFSFVDVAQALSLEVILSTVFGIDDDAERRRHSKAIRGVVESVKPLFLFVKAFQVAPFGLGPWANFNRKQAAAGALLQEQIDRVRDVATDRNDILSMLLNAEYDDGSKMSDDEIKDQLRTLLTAGHETTAFALTWAQYCWFKHDDARTMLMEEIHANPGADPNEIARLPYLEAFLKEVLRIYPAATEVLRLLRKPIVVSGRTLEPGVAVAPCVTLVHNNADLYPEPEAFRPERFLERSFGPHEYLPFGGGHRRCIGAAFAMMELKCAFFTLLSETTITRTDDAVLKMKREHLSMSPGHALNVRIEPAVG